MTHVPDHPVAGRVEQVMNGNRQLDHTQPRTQMAARHRNGIDKLVSQLIGKLG